MITYDKNGNCTKCGLPGSGFVSDGVCHCEMAEEREPVYWLSPVKERDDFGDSITDEIIDGKTSFGPWALMTPKSWRDFSGTNGKLGLGLGQRYKKQANSRWLKVEG
jgi:hypothetical protein